MVSHLVCRRLFTPYGLILYHPCGDHSYADDDAAEEPLHGDGALCDACASEGGEEIAVVIAAR